MQNLTDAQFDFMLIAALKRLVLADPAGAHVPHLGVLGVDAPDRAHVQPPEEQLRDRIVAVVSERRKVTMAELGRALKITKSQAHTHGLHLAAKSRVKWSKEPVDGRMQVVLRPIDGVVTDVP